jgi:glucokinase
MPDPCVVGVDMGGTKLLAGAIDETLTVRHRAHRTLAGLDQDALLDIAVDAVEEIRAASRVPILAYGFGIPATIDRRRGVAIQAVHLPLHDVPFAAVMGERLGLPVVVDNDANVAALAEHRAGAAKGTRDSVTLTLGTGIGSGLVLDDRLYRGATGAGGELGHMVIDLDGPVCPCGNRGCLEAIVSGTALARDGREAAAREPRSALGRALAEGNEITGALVTDLAHAGDSAAREVVERAGAALGVGIANIANVLEPEVVVIGGGVIGAGELLLEPARDELKRRALAPARDTVRVVAAHFGAEAGMIGAALLAFEYVGAMG